MSDNWFSDNYSDLSAASGLDAGFQFEFYCERCRDAFRTDFEPYRSAKAAGWAQRASGLLGGLLGEAGDALESVAEAGFRKGRDEAFRRAIDTARAHFRRCARCHQHVCAKCWNEASGLCYNCAPDAEVEIEAAKAAGRVYGAGEKAANEGIREGKQMDVRRDRQLVCPNCGAEAHGAKFCPECGSKLGVQNHCTSCGAELPPGAKFCGECGAKAAT